MHSAIPAFVMEEHNEAFFVWSEALRNGGIQRNSRLLHFDDHSDLKVPVLPESVNDIMKGDAVSVANFTSKVLKIDTFIIPAIYAGIINELFWIRHSMSRELDLEMYVRSYNNGGKRLISDRVDKLKGEPTDHKLYRYVKVDALNFLMKEHHADKPVLLDIDLDYFSCCEEPVTENEVIIEITRGEYNSFVNDRYHYLNFITTKIDAVQHKDSYFFVINRFNEQYPSKREVSGDEIRRRIQEFTACLSRAAIRPQLVTICRSRFSGYTPGHQWEVIEAELLSALREIYDLEIQQINTIFEKLGV